MSFAGASTHLRKPAQSMEMNHDALAAAISTTPRRGRGGEGEAGASLHLSRRAVYSSKLAYYPSVRKMNEFNGF
jgi:hypothetical protein